MSAPGIRAMRLAAASLLAALAGAMGLIALALTALVATPLGARSALRAAAPFAPGALTVDSVRGSLATVLELRGVRYGHPTVQAELDTVIVDVAWGALSSGRFELERLAVDGGFVRVTRDDVVDESSGEPPALPAIPASVAAAELAVTDLEVEGFGSPVHVERVSGALDGARLTLDTLALDAVGVRLEADAEMTVARARAAGSLRATATLPAETLADGSESVSQELSLAGAFELVTDADPWYAAFDWTAASWRDGPAGDVASPRGRVTVTPGTEPLAIDLRAELEAAALPGGVATVEAEAGLAAGALSVERLQAAMLGGEIVARGAVDLDALGGFASFDFDAIDPAMLDPRVTGMLAGELDVAFALRPTPSVTAVGAGRGRLGERALEAEIRASYAAGMLDIERADARLDEGRLELAGLLTPESADLRFAARLPNLGHWYPPASGSVTASGTVAGDTSNPTVAFDLAAEGLALADTALPPIAELTLAVDGVRDAHRVRLAALSGANRVSFATEQSVADARVAGTLLQSELNLERAGTWRLAAPSRFAAAAGEASVEQACFIGPARAELCIGIEESTAAVTARGVPNSLAGALLPGGVSIDGRADAALDVDWSGPLSGSFELRQSSLIVTAAAAAEEGAEPLPPGETDIAGLQAELADVTVSAALTEERLTVQLTATLAETGDPIGGDLVLAPPSADGELDGRVTASLTELTLLDALIEGIENLSGALELAVDISGSAAAPELTGRLTVRSLEVTLPPLGIEIADGRLSVETAGLRAVTFAGALCSGGCLSFDGRAASPEAEPWRLDAAVRGERFELAALPDLRAVVSPDLMLAADPESWRLTGALNIAEGRVAIADVPRSAVRPAPETVVHGRPEPTVDEQPLPIPLAVNVTARLGDVRFVGLGVEAELDGVLEVERTIAGAVRVRGTTGIEEGSFRAYGQELTIERGLLIFTGPPENPALDIRAARVVEGATVGLDITGSARNPRSVVFSDPALSESEAFARLLTGRSLATSGSAGDPEALERAALGLGLRRALPTLNRWGTNLGLDELSVDSAAGGPEGGALVAGKQLGEDIVLRYRHGLFDQFSGLELIYQITDRFRLRTETGTAQSIDLVYQVGRDVAGSATTGADVGEGQGGSPAEIVGPNLPGS